MNKPSRGTFVGWVPYSCGVISFELRWYMIMWFLSKNDEQLRECTTPVSMNRHSRPQIFIFEHEWICEWTRSWKHVFKRPTSFEDYQSVSAADYQKLRSVKLWMLSANYIRDHQGTHIPMLYWCFFKEHILAFRDSVSIKSLILGFCIRLLVLNTKHERCRFGKD